MTHPSTAEWMRFLDGEVTANRAAQMHDHADGCADCEREMLRLRTTIEQIERPIAMAGPGAVEEIMQRIGALPDRPEEPVRRISNRTLLMWAGGGALAAAAALAFVAIAPSKREGVFSARGGAAALGDAAELERNVGFSFFAGSAGEIAQGAKISSRAELTARYRNLLDVPVYALVFAIDAAGEVHWLYPAFVDPETVPVAERLTSNEREGRFGDGVVLDAPASGPMSLIALISREPMTVAAIESLSIEQRTPAAIAARWSDSSLQSIDVEVEAAP